MPALSYTYVERDPLACENAGTMTDVTSIKTANEIASVRTMYSYDIIT